MIKKTEKELRKEFKKAVKLGKILNLVAILIVGFIIIGGMSMYVTAEYQYQRVFGFIFSSFGILVISVTSFFALKLWSQSN